MPRTKPPLAIYLDQNKWIDLARAYHRLPNGAKYQDVLEKIEESVEQKQAFFPLSYAHLIETRKSRDVVRRQRLATVMAKISLGAAISTQQRMTQWELSKALAIVFGEIPPEIPSAFGYGVPFAFGQVEKLYKKYSHEKVAMSESQIKTINDFLSSTDVIEKFLTGDNREEENLLAIERYEKSSQDFILRAEKFRSDVKAYDKRLHKRAYTAMLTLAIQAELTQILKMYGKTLDDFLGLGQESLMAFFENVSTLNVEIELAIERNENWDKKVHENDKMDSAFLSVAIPYCDIVVTERFWKFSAQKRGLDKKYDTVIINDLNELEDFLV